MARYGRRRYWDAFAQPSTYMVGARALEAKLALKAEGLELSPVEPVKGHRIATTFWGQAWCRNLTRYSDYENRMPRGRSYVRHGSVVHLEVEPGEIHALVSGSDLYRVTIRIEPLARKQWDAILGQCAGEIEDLVHLLRGEPPKRVMEIVTRPGDGLFPTPKEIELDCSCPDWADMCKHAAAVLYGVGVRLDHDPEQLFRLRSVDPNDLVSAVPDAAESDEDDALAGEDLSALFGIRLEGEDSPATSGAPGSMGAVRRKVSRRKVSRKKATRKKVTRKKATRKKAVRKKSGATRKKATGAAGRKVARRKIGGGAAVTKKATRKKVSSVTTVRKKATRKKTAVRKKAVRKKAATTTAPKKATRKKTTTRKKVARKKTTTRKKAARKKAVRKKAARKTAVRRKTAGR